MNIEIQKNVPLGPLTWYGVGGVAESFVQPKTVQQLSLLLNRCHACDTPVHVIGKGANLLVPEGIVEGLVIQLAAPPFRQVQIEGQTIIAGAGVNLGTLINIAANHGLAGLEILAGIPASVGGAVRMNAGGKFGEIGAVVKRVTCMTIDGQMMNYSRDELSFEYRKSNIVEPLIVEVEFALAVDDTEKLKQRVKEIFDFKTATQPMGDKSVGCTFKNPSPDGSDCPAGKLIDDAGLKGFRMGGAEVSTHHANFIITHAPVKAAEIVAVIEHIEKIVRDRFGVQLNREVVIWNVRR